MYPKRRFKNHALRKFTEIISGRLLDHFEMKLSTRHHIANTFKHIEFVVSQTTNNFLVNDISRFQALVLQHSVAPIVTCLAAAILLASICSQDVEISGKQNRQKYFHFDLIYHETSYICQKFALFHQYQTRKNNLEAKYKTQNTTKSVCDMIENDLLHTTFKLLI